MTTGTALCREARGERALGLGQGQFSVCYDAASFASSRRETKRTRPDTGLRRVSPSLQRCRYETEPGFPVEAFLFRTVFESVVLDLRSVPERPQGAVAREARL